MKLKNIYIYISSYVHHMNHMNLIHDYNDYIHATSLFSSKPMDVLEYQPERVDFDLILQVHPVTD